jgi:hypothetical protein
VKKGQVLALLDNSDMKTKRERSREVLDKATVDLDDRLIDYGFRLKDSLKVPLEIMRMAKIKSGYNSARMQVEFSVLETEYHFFQRFFGGGISFWTGTFNKRGSNTDKSYKSFERS